MAQKSGGKKSKLGLRRHHLWSLENLLHFAIFQDSWQQRLHFKNMIAYKRHTDTSRSPRLKVSKVQHCFINEGSKLQVGDGKLGSPGKSPTRSPTKSHHKDLLKPFKFKKKSSEKGHRKSMTSLPAPLASRLVRTMSMHHLKSSRYVSPNESCDNRRTTSDSVSNSVGIPSGSTFLQSAQNEPQKVCQQCGNVPGYNLAEQIHQSKDLLDFLQFFNENKNLLMNIARNPHLLLANESHEKPASHSDQGMGLNKSNTFPRPGTLINKEGTPGSPYLPPSATDDSKTIRSNIKKAIKENKKEVTYIANDGFLHKVPYGQKDCEGRKRNYRKEGGEARMRRSTSLSDSLDKYSNLFEFISKEQPKLTDCRTGSPEKSFNLAFKRIHSSPEIKTYSAFIHSSVITSSRSATDITNAHFSAEAEPLDNELGANEFETVSLSLCTDEEVEPLDLHFCINEVERLDPESDDDEGIQPNIEENTNYDSSFFDDISAISQKQSLTGYSVMSGTIDYNEQELEEDRNELHVRDHDSIAVDEGDVAYFLYIKDILAKSGLTGSKWHSSEQPALDPAFLELEPEAGPDQLLLYDLTNEALVDA
ncbi:Protein TRM32 [Rhynchospora pubera]|uniref:Protein TRM32 n=1 Tax=Rhynchospora pubera TaxID=906938 RepID=A0AAV8H0J3_9POAL|nr:Protein TRM32 [Rhynchospora pubera]